MLTARLHSLEYIRLEKQNVAISVVAFLWNDRAFRRSLPVERRPFVSVGFHVVRSDIRRQRRQIR